MGDLVEISIAVCTDSPYVDLLFTERLRLGFHGYKRVLRLARLFKAVGVAIASLDEFYGSLMRGINPCSPSRYYFPDPCPHPLHAGSMPSLTFTGRMAHSGRIFRSQGTQDDISSGIYIATMSSPTAPNDCMEVVVKFTSLYNSDAHRILASKGYAPILHAVIPVCGDLFMVVMDRVCGKTIASHMQDSPQMRLPYTIYEDIQAALKLLHAQDLVFGDLRTPNIMCVDSDAGLRARLIDFDWVGEDGVAQYPATMDSTLQPPGAERRGVMRKVHDELALQYLKTMCELRPDSAQIDTLDISLTRLSL
jgi:hypothetical protein